MTMTDSCLGCGLEPEVDDRFCAECGLGLGARATTDDPAAPAEAQPTTIGPARLSPPSGREIGAGRGVTRLLTVATLVAAAVLAWRIFQPPTAPLDGVSVALHAVDARAPANWPPAGSERPLVEVATDELFSDSVSVDRRAFSSDPSIGPPPANGPTISALDLEGLDGHYLVVANQGGIVRIDPATGIADSFTTNGMVIGHHDDLLVIFGRPGVLRTAPVADPEDQRMLHEFGGSQIAAMELSPEGTVTVTFWETFGSNSDEPEFETVTVDLTSGGAESRTTPVDQFGRHDGVGYSPGFGTFETEADGRYRWLSDGAIDAAGRHLVLLTECAEPGECDQFWLDRRSGERVERLRPPSLEQGFWYWEVIGPDDRFVVLGDHSGRSYFDTLTGDVLGGSEHSGSSTPMDVDQEAFSPDGRYLFVPDRDEILMHDLEKGMSFSLPVDIPGRPSRIEIVPKPKVAS